MSPEYGFLGALLTTVALLVGAVFTGRARKIRAHVGFAAASVMCLAVAIVFALKVGELYDLEAAGRITPIHLALARITTVSFLWPVLTGPLAAWKKVNPKVHRAGAYLALVLTLASTVTGLMMLAGAERIVQ